MSDEYLKQFTIKPIFNLNWYKGDDQYSEGNIEDKVLKIIADNEPENYSKAISEEFSWSTYYHLNVLRQNILNWYPFDPESSVLEVGCGMGAITNLLCARCKKVTSVELSKRRAKATLLRCRDKDNLEIIVGNLNDIPFEEKFDYITLIGVFEYQGSYTESDDPYGDFLRKIKGLLKPNGKLLMAIENQYGLKYWCGAREDHTGIPFDGINQYAFSDKKVRTFSKHSLEQMVKDCGFSNTYFYYPMPDYKLPTVVYSQKHLPQEGNMLNMRFYYIPDDKTMIAQESKIYHDVIENGVFDFFANSFLLECSECGEVGKIVFASMSNRRLTEYQIATRFTEDGMVEKYALRPTEGNRHIDEIVKNESELRNRGIKVWRSELNHHVLRSPYCENDTVEVVLVKKSKIKDRDGVIRIWDQLNWQICNASEKAEWSDNIIYSFFPDKERDEKKYGIILKKGYLDMILRNSFLINDDFYWFDQEWSLENVPAQYVMYRALVETYSSFPEIKSCVPMVEMADRYGLIESWKDMQELERLFVGVIIDADFYDASRNIPGGSINACINSINKLLS